MRMVYPVLCTAGCYVTVITLFIKKVGVVRPFFLVGGLDPPPPRNPPSGCTLDYDGSPVSEKDEDRYFSLGTQIG